MRIAVLDPSGVPNPGSANLFVVDLNELTAEPVYTDADEIKEKNACGAVEVNYTGDDSFDRLDITLSVWKHEPSLMAALSGGEVLTDSGLTGWAMPAIGSLSGPGVSIEVWAKRIDDGDLDAEQPYGWWIFPKVKNLRMGTKSFTNGASLLTFTGRGLENPNWFDGPLNDWPVASDRAMEYFPVSSLPTITCGPSALAAS